MKLFRPANQHMDNNPTYFKWGDFFPMVQWEVLSIKNQAGFWEWNTYRMYHNTTEILGYGDKIRKNDICISWEAI